jgi:hypothetical protein
LDLLHSAASGHAACSGVVCTSQKNSIVREVASCERREMHL